MVELSLPSGVPIPESRLTLPLSVLRAFRAVFHKNGRRAVLDDPVPFDTSQGLPGLLLVGSRPVTSPAMGPSHEGQVTTLPSRGPPLTGGISK